MDIYREPVVVVVVSGDDDDEPIEMHLCILNMHAATFRAWHDYSITRSTTDQRIEL